MSNLVDVMDISLFESQVLKRDESGNDIVPPQNVSHVFDAYFQGDWTANYCKLMDVRMLQDPVA